MHLLVSESNTDPTRHKQLSLFAFGMEFVGHGRQAPLILACPVIQMQAVPFHPWLTPHLLTHKVPSFMNPMMHWQVPLSSC